MTNRIDFGSRFVERETLVVVVLIAGVPIVLCPAGVAPTATAVSAGTVDPLWWPGVGALTYDLPTASSISPVRAWLDPKSVFEVFRAVDPLRGDAKVEALGFDVFDPAAAATAVLSGPRARAAQRLAASVTSAATSIPIDSTSGVPSSGIAWLGREAILYDGLGGGALTLTSSPARRGAFGSRARGHRLDTTNPAIVSFGAWPRYLYGRLASVWLCRLSGTTLYDPTCIYLGTVGPGVQRSASGARWQIPIDNVVEILSRKLAPRTVTVFGWAHIDSGFGVRAPLRAGSAPTVLNGTSTVTDDDGWHPDAASFVDDWNAYASALGDSVTASLAGGYLSTRHTLGAGAGSAVVTAWDTPTQVELTADASGIAAWTSREPCPDTCLHFDGMLPLPTPGDLAKIPSTLTFTMGGSLARFTLSVDKTARGEELSALILETGTRGVRPFARVTATVNTGTRLRDRQQRTLITQRTAATLGVCAEGETAEALQAAALALDALDGGLHEDVIDWTAIAAAFVGTPVGSLPSARQYLFGDKDTLLNALSHEARLRGMAMCSRNGRLSVYRTAVFASTEETTATIIETDVLCDDGGGRPLEPEVIDAPSPVATSLTFTLPNGGSYQWIDNTSRSEFGDGSDVTCNALEWVPPGTDLAGVVSTIQQVAQQVLGVLAEPYRLVRVVLGPRFLGLQEGDLVLFSHSRVPTYLGTLGVTAQTCQIQEARLQVMGGRGRLVASLRLQEPDLAGYAPEALCAAGGVDHASHVVTIDTTSAFGPTCFSRALRPDGSAATNAVDGFRVGQLVRLSQIGTRTPMADETFTLTAVDPVAGTLTLDGFPSLAMAAAAASAYGVLVRFDDWPSIDAAAPTVRDDQERYLFIADASSGDLGSGDSPKRWAA